MHTENCQGFCTRYKIRLAYPSGLSYSADYEWHGLLPEERQAHTNCSEMRSDQMFYQRKGRDSNHAPTLLIINHLGTSDCQTTYFTHLSSSYQFIKAKILPDR